MIRGCLRQFLKREPRRTACLALLLVAFVLVFPQTALGWPTDNDWIPIYKGGEFLGDLEGDAATSRDIVGNADYGAAYLFNDGNYIYFRVRLDEDPLTSSGTELNPFGWGFLLDLDQNLDDYEYMIMLDGILNPEAMYLARNTFQADIGDPSDKPEIVLWQETLTYGTNFRVLSAGANFPLQANKTNADFFLDWRIPYSVFKASMGLSEDSVIRYFVGSSDSTQTLSADLVAGSTLYDGSSNYVLPSGAPAETGSVHFVKDPAGNTGLTEFYAGETIYVKVVDPDLNSISSEVQTATVQVESPSGDLETISLTETGADTGTFIGSVPTIAGLSSNGDGTLQLSPIEFVEVTYIDVADGTDPPLRNQERTDLAKVMPASDIAVIKTVDDPTPSSGDTIVYTIRVTNNGPSSAEGIQITDDWPATGVAYASHTAPAGTSYNPSTGLWAAGDLAKDAYKELTINATVNGTANQTFVNTATRTASAHYDPDAENDSASATVSVTGADLSLAKFVDDHTPAEGGTVKFTLTATNTGSTVADDVVVTDELPPGTWSDINVLTAEAGTDYVDTDADNLPDTLTWSIDSIPYPGSAVLEFEATLNPAVPAGAEVTNTATVTASTADPDPADNTASDTLIVNGVDLSVAKTVQSPDPATPDVGDTVTFTVSVANSAEVSTTATGIVIEDLLPEGLAFVSAVPSTGAYSQGNGQWNVGSLDPTGAPATLTLTAEVEAGSAGRTLTNKASVINCDQKDVDPDNDAASAAVTVRSTDLEVFKQVDNAAPADGTDIEFTITVTNRSAVAATGIAIFDQLPSQVTYKSSAATEGTYSSDTSLWSGIDLAAEDPGNPAQMDHQATLTIIATVDLGQNDAETFFNTASLQASTPEDGNATNNVSSAIVSVEGVDLGVTKALGTGTNNPAAGASVQFVITLTNHDDKRSATGVKVTDTLPDGFTCSSVSISPAGLGSASCPTGNNSAVTWNFGNSDTLSPLASATLTVNGTVPDTPGTITNRVQIASADQADPEGANNSDSLTLYVGASDLSLSKIVDDPTPREGDTINYTITVSNAGPSDVGAIEVTDLLPAGMTYDSHTTTGTAYDPATGIWNVGTLTYSAGSPGTASLELKATVDADTAGSTIVNQASITGAGALDPDATDDEASASITVQQADVYVTKEADNLTPYVGRTVTFTITAGNNGPHTATDLTVTDLLPGTPDGETAPSPVFSNITATPAGGTTYNSATGQWNIPSLAKNATASLTITATVNSGTEGLNITNTATVTTTEDDPTVANNTSSITLTPQELQIDLRLTKEVDSSSTSTPVEGNDVVFKLSVSNLHTSEAANGVVVTDTLPDNLTFVSASTETGSITSSPAVGSSGDVVWAIADLAPMSNTSLLISARVALGTGGIPLTNNAAITSFEQSDPINGNNSASVTVVPESTADLTVMKTVQVLSDPYNGANPKAIPGAEMLYTLMVTNHGTGPADGDSVIVLDTIPADTSLFVADPIVTFAYTDPDAGNGQALTFTPSSDLCFSNGACPITADDCGISPYDYTPTDDGSGVDPNVTCLRIKPSGTLEGATASQQAGFTLTFKVRVR